MKSETDQRETSAVYNLDAQCADSSLGEIHVLALYVMQAFLWYSFHHSKVDSRVVNVRVAQQTQAQER